jgi:hypothetical protein
MGRGLGKGWGRCPLSRPHLDADSSAAEKHVAEWAIPKSTVCTDQRLTAFPRFSPYTTLSTALQHETHMSCSSHAAPRLWRVHIFAVYPRRRRGAQPAGGGHCCHV